MVDISYSQKSGAVVEEPFSLGFCRFGIKLVCSNLLHGMRMCAVCTHGIVFGETFGFTVEKKYFGFVSIGKNAEDKTKIKKRLFHKNCQTTKDRLIR